MAWREHVLQGRVHEYVIAARDEAANPQHQGTKACAVYKLALNAAEQKILHFRLHRAGTSDLPQDQWDGVFESRIREASSSTAIFHAA